MASRDAIARFARRILVGAAVATTIMISTTQHCAAQEEKPTLQELMLDKDPLLKELFAKSPEDDVKGLAAKIKAEEITVKHRIKAIRYLATVDCVAYPEAKAMLVKMLHKDKWEPVRYEAAKALRIMLATGACSEKREGSNYSKWLWAFRRNNRRTPAGAEKRRYDYCPGCCDKDTLNALVKTAYEMNDKASCFEPSLRVREMAVEAIKSCGIKCNCGPYYAADGVEEMGPPPADSGSGGEVQPPPSGGGEVQPPPAPPEATPGIDAASRSGIPTSTVSMRRTQTLSVAADPLKTPVPCLKGYCVVNLVAGRRVAARSGITSLYKGRIYHFADVSAKQQFDREPEKFALAYGGFDPVHYVRTQGLADGTLLCEFRGKLYSFASQANWQEFLKTPERYLTTDQLMPSTGN